jgi:recombinational DNA repair protein RecR
MSLMWARIIDDITKRCEVGLGNNEKLYVSKNMSLMDVEKAYNGIYYIMGYAPTSSTNTIREKEIEDLKKELQKYDYIGVKIATGCATIDEYREEIAYCETIREKIRQLESME